MPTSAYRRRVCCAGLGLGAFLSHNQYAGAHGGGGGARGRRGRGHHPPPSTRRALTRVPSRPPAMASSRINVLCVTDSGEVREEKAVVRTEDYDTFLICGDRKERLANAQHAIIRDVSGTTHPVIVWDDGSCEDGDGDHDHSHPVYALLVPRSIYTVDCPVAGNIVITGQGTNIPNGDTSDSENENEE